MRLSLSGSNWVRKAKRTKAKYYACNLARDTNVTINDGNQGGSSQQPQPQKAAPASPAPNPQDVLRAKEAVEPQKAKFSRDGSGDGRVIRMELDLGKE